jgi:hypothetical protein
MLDYLEMESNEAWDGDSAFDSWDYESESSENGENVRRRRGPMRPVPAARGLNAFRPRPNTGAAGPVTQGQLNAALARVRTEVTANANGIKTLDGRVRTVVADQQRFETSTRKQVDKLRSDLKTTQTISALVPLIAPPGSKFGNVASLIHLVGPDLMGGSGGSSGTGASNSSGILGGGSNNLIAIGALLYASGAFKS